MRIEIKSRRRNGFATLIVLLLISFMLALVGANLNGLFQLKREVQLLEKRHQKRWASLNAAVTNAPASRP